MAPGARERQTGSRWQSGAAGLRAKLQQRASATMPKFRVLLNPDTDNDFFFSTDFGFTCVFFPS